MVKSMNVAIMKDIGEIDYIKRPVPAVGDNDVLVKLKHVGICGSDVHYYQTGRIGDFIVEPPFVLGHEAAGIVVEAGRCVKHLAPGDRVALEPGKTCGKCEYCREGKYNLCPDVEFFATPPYDGVFQEYVAHDASLCFKLPDNVSTLEGSLIEPLAVGFHSAMQGEARVGQSAVVFGAGAIGLAILLALKAMGVSTIIVSDIMQNRLDKALELGATHVLNAKECDVVKEVMNITNDRGADLALETAGIETTTNNCIRAVKKGANIVLVGYSESGRIDMEVSEALNKEVTIKTVFRYRHIYPMAIEAVASGVINAEDMVTDIFHFDDLKNAMESSTKNKMNIVKAVIEF